MQINSAQWIAIKLCIAGLLVGGIALAAQYYREIWFVLCAFIVLVFLIADWKWNPSRISFYITLAFAASCGIVIYLIAFVWNN